MIENSKKVMVHGMENDYFVINEQVLEIYSNYYSNGKVASTRKYLFTAECRHGRIFYINCYINFMLEMETYVCE